MDMHLARLGELPRRCAGPYCPGLGGGKEGCGPGCDLPVTACTPRHEAEPGGRHGDQGRQGDDEHADELGDSGRDGPGDDRDDDDDGDARLRLRIGEALAVSLRCRTDKGRTLRVREQVNPAGQLRPLKFRRAGAPGQPGGTPP
jgi:hypothetical protein